MNTPVVIVTGAAGRALAPRLADDGFAVVVVYLRSRAEAEATVDAIVAAGGSAVTIRADLADRLDRERLFEETVAAFGRVDAVFLS